MRYLSNRGYGLGAPAPTGHLTIGGTCSMRGAISPNTGQPLLQHASIRLDPKAFWINGWASPDLALLYSWKCDIHLGDLSYRQSDGTILVIEHHAGRSDLTGFPYDGYPVAFEPHRFDLSEASARAPSEPRHQFGGRPFLFDPEEGKSCVGCRKEMTLAATIGNENFSTDEGFFGNDFVQLICWVCPDCQVVAVRNRTD